MDLTINNAGIDERAIRAARAADCFGGKPDAVFLTLDAAAVPARTLRADDVLTLDGADHFIAEAEETGGETSVTAASVRGAGLAREWAVYRDLTLGELMEAAAEEMGMRASCAGIDTDIFYRRIVRKDETPAEMMNRILVYENAALKAERGTLYAVSWELIEAQKSALNLAVDDLSGGVYRRTRDGCGRVIVSSLRGDGDASDERAPKELTEKIGGLEVIDAGQAQRWAYGILRERNRYAETLSMSIGNDAGVFAGCRIELSGSGLDGGWIAVRCERDMMNGRMALELVRCGA